jgi:hypothetical protein
MERTIVDFTATDQGTGTLARAVPRVDPAADGAQQWDIDLVFAVDEVQADHVEGALPQAGEYLARARDGKGSATITIKPTDRDVRLTLRDTDGEVVLEDVAAEVRQIKMALTEKAQAYTARLRLYGMRPDQGAQLLAYLGGALQLHTQPAQLSMDFGTDAPLGALVTGSDGMEDVFGVLYQKRGESYVIDDFGVLHTVGELTASIPLGPDGQDVAQRYADQVRADDGSPTWRDLVAAMAATGCDRMTDEVVEHALHLRLPPEAGVAHG